MKTILQLLIIFSSITGVFATAPNKIQLKKNNEKNRLLPSRMAPHSLMRNGNNVDHTASVIWSDDFSVSANWTIGHDAGTTGDWVIGTTPPSGPYSILPIESTSANNGFALFDSDLLCTGNQIGNLTNSTPINCTGHSAVRLVFQEYYRRITDSTFIYLSNDGTNWTKFSVNTQLTDNAFCSANPSTIIVDVTSVAANQATVFVRFTFYSPSSMGIGAGCAYSWMVDDVKLEDFPANDVGMADVGFPGEYTLIPFSQVQPLNIYANVYNNGLNTATNVGTQLDIFRIQSGVPVNVYSNTSATIPSLNPGDTASILAGTYTPNNVGIYLVQYLSIMANTDVDASNDTLFRYFIITDSIYGRDYTPVTGILDNSLGADNNNPISMGQVYDFVSPANLTSISFYLSSPVLDNTVRVSVYSVTGGIPSTSSIAATTVYTITNSDIGGAFITLPFSSPILLSPGEYLISVDQLLNDSNITLGFTNNIFTPNKVFYRYIGPWITLEAAGYTGAFVIEPNFVSGNCSAHYTLYQDTIPHNWIAVNQATGVPPLSYTWSWGDSTTSTGITPIHTYSDSGYYNICLSIIDSVGCTATYCDSSTYIHRPTSNSTMITITVVDTSTIASSIVNLEASPEINIYPNPVTRQLTIGNKQYSITRIEIIDMLGKKIFKSEISNQKSVIQIDVSDFAKGIYFCKVTTVNGVQVKKFAKN